jgi:hypothetical protein
MECGMDMIAINFQSLEHESFSTDQASQIAAAGSAAAG